MANSYFKGQIVRLEGTFKDPTNSNTLVSPSSVSVIIEDPSSVETTVTPTEDGVGRFHYDLTLDEVGTWRYRFESTGTYQTAGEKELTVKATFVS